MLSSGALAAAILRVYFGKFLQLFCFLVFSFFFNPIPGMNVHAMVRYIGTSVRFLSAVGYRSSVQSDYR